MAPWLASVATTRNYNYGSGRLAGAADAPSEACLLSCLWRWGDGMQHAWGRGPYVTYEEPSIAAVCILDQCHGFEGRQPDTAPVKPVLFRQGKQHVKSPQRAKRTAVLRSSAPWPCPSAAVRWQLIQRRQLAELSAPRKGHRQGRAAPSAPCVAVLRNSGTQSPPEARR